MAAIELIAEEPIRFVTERVTHCDGGKLVTFFFFKKNGYAYQFMYWSI